MSSPAITSATVSRPLLAWYDQNRRSLPWRALPGQRTPAYAVWISEIMLQQTTVAAVIPYFHKFLERWPTIEALANAPLDDVLSAWAGLGYYSRARNLHKCARYLVENCAGVFPETLSELLELPGVGPYTAAAIRAIAFDQSANVVDGNVERVMARLYAVQTPLPKAKAELIALAAALVPTKRVGDYAQALMDLGATVCTPKSPDCPRCPLLTLCQARTHGIEASLPARAKPAARPVRQALVFVLEDGQKRLWLRRRPEKGLLGGMIEFPSTPWQDSALPPLPTALSQLEAPHLPAPTQWHASQTVIKHVFTHFELRLTLVWAKTDKKSTPEGIWLNAADAADNALPSLMAKVLRAYLHLHTEASPQKRQFGTLEKTAARV